MGITTRKGDSGYTSLLRGQRVPKYHLVTEAVGSLDEANAHLGLARAVSGERRIKRILLHVQKHIFTIGSELSVPKGKGPPPKKQITEADIKWLERLIEDFEEVLSLPPGFVAFGQVTSSSRMDVVRTSIRKAERTVARMKDKGMIQNVCILKYLNRLSDMFFVMACFEERSEDEKRKMNNVLMYLKLSDPVFRKWAVISGIIMLSLITTIIMILIFHNPTRKAPADQLSKHMEEMQDMHGERQ
jgi:cob(I)alamin adenosyltransferase